MLNRMRKKAIRVLTTSSARFNTKTKNRVLVYNGDNGLWAIKRHRMARQHNDACITIQSSIYKRVVEYNIIKSLNFKR